MEVNFNKTSQTESTAPETKPTTAVATQADNPMQLGDFVPTFAEIILPRLNLVHSVGKMKDSFIPGSFVYDQRVVLYVPPLINRALGKVEREGTPPVRITVLGVRPTRYVENVKGGGKGIIVDTPDAVTAAGGTLSYKEWQQKSKDGMKRFDYMAESLLAIERPASVADDDTVFTFEVGDKKYALALYSMKASAFTVAKKTIFAWKAFGCLNKGFPTCSLQLSSIEKPTPDGTSTYWCPVLVPGVKSTPEFIDFAKNVLNAKTVDSPDTEDGE